jgi:hypothetical protein
VGTGGTFWQRTKVGKRVTHECKEIASFSSAEERLGE